MPHYPGKNTEVEYQVKSRIQTKTYKNHSGLRNSNMGIGVDSKASAGNHGLEELKGNSK